MEQKNRGYRFAVIAALILTGITVFSIVIYDALVKNVDIVADGRKISIDTRKKQ